MSMPHPNSSPHHYTTATYMYNIHTYQVNDFLLEDFGKQVRLAVTREQSKAEGLELYLRAMQHAPEYLSRGRVEGHHTQGTGPVTSVPVEREAKVI